MIKSKRIDLKFFGRKDMRLFSCLFIQSPTTKTPYFLYQPTKNIATINLLKFKQTCIQKNACILVRIIGISTKITTLKSQQSHVHGQDCMRFFSCSLVQCPTYTVSPKECAKPCLNCPHSRIRATC